MKNNKREFELQTLPEPDQEEENPFKLLEPEDVKSYFESPGCILDADAVMQGYNRIIKYFKEEITILLPRLRGLVLGYLLGSSSDYLTRLSGLDFALSSLEKIEDLYPLLTLLRKTHPVEDFPSKKHLIVQAILKNNFLLLRHIVLLYPFNNMKNGVINALIGDADTSSLILEVINKIKTIVVDEDVTPSQDTEIEYPVCQHDHTIIEIKCSREYDPISEEKIIRYLANINIVGQYEGDDLDSHLKLGQSVNSAIWQFDEKQLLSLFQQGAPKNFIECHRYQQNPLSYPFHSSLDILLWKTLHVFPGDRTYEKLSQILDVFNILQPFYDPTFALDRVMSYFIYLIHDRETRDSGYEYWYHSLFSRMVVSLAKNGADLNTPLSSQRLFTPLEFAFEIMGDRVLANQLLKYGADNCPILKRIMQSHPKDKLLPKLLFLFQANKKTDFDLFVKLYNKPFFLVSPMDKKLENQEITNISQVIQYAIEEKEPGPKSKTYTALRLFCKTHIQSQNQQSSQARLCPSPSQT